MHQLLSAHKGGRLPLLRHMVSLGDSLKDAGRSGVWMSTLLGSHKVEEQELQGLQGLPDEEEEEEPRGGGGGGVRT